MTKALLSRKPRHSCRGAVTVDLQHAFMNRDTRCIIPKVEKKLQDYRHIAATRFHNQEGSNYRRLLDWDACSAEDSGFSLVLDLPERAMIFDKPGYNGLTPLFQQTLSRLGIKTVHICGVDTDACILATAIGIFDLGLRPVVIASACASSGGFRDASRWVRYFASQYWCCPGGSITVLFVLHTT